jgi:hypothetical protein
MSVPPTAWDRTGISPNEPTPIVSPTETNCFPRESSCEQIGRTFEKSGVVHLLAPPRSAARQQGGVPHPQYRGPGSALRPTVDLLDPAGIRDGPERRETNTDELSRFPIYSDSRTQQDRAFAKSAEFFVALVCVRSCATASDDSCRVSRSCSAGPLILGSTVHFRSGRRR